MAKSEYLDFSEKILQDLARETKLPKLIQENNIKFFSEETTKLDIISYHLEQRETDSAFYIIDLGTVFKQYKRWVANLPRVEPFYAIKSSPNPLIVKTLA